MLVIFAVALLLISIVVLVILHVCVVRRTFGSFNNIADTENYRNLTKGLSADELEKLPFNDYKGGESGNETKAECSICLDGFQVGDRCRLLPICRHNFHAKCVDSWLTKTAMCPICRSKVRESISASVSDNRSRDLSGGGDEFELHEIVVVAS